MTQFNSGEINLISITPDAEKLIAYCARVSSDNQENPNIKGLLKYCAKHGHWSVFEQASMTVEIKCPIAIATQILRHKSFCFQQFSQRYQAISEDNYTYTPELRLQAATNRQDSVTPDETISSILSSKYEDRINKLFNDSLELYRDMLTSGVAKECARFVLPQSTMTRLYMTGNIRSFIHYLEARTKDGVQKEHRDLALAIAVIFKQQLPIISEAIGFN